MISESRINEEFVKDDLSIPGIIIVTILGLIVILIIILICHAQKQKVSNVYIANFDSSQYITADLYHFRNGVMLQMQNQTGELKLQSAKVLS